MKLEDLKAGRPQFTSTIKTLNINPKVDLKAVVSPSISTIGTIDDLIRNEAKGMDYFTAVATYGKIAGFYPCDDKSGQCSTSCEKYKGGCARWESGEKIKAITTKKEHGRKKKWGRKTEKQ